MCGIAGFLYADTTRPPERERLVDMAAAIAHRGPDGCGYFTGPGIGLAHRRLSIIDLAGGTQPLGNEDGSVQVVFNGEIYNYRELRSRLEGRGHRFATQSDTEVLVHLYEERGDTLVDELRGMFAFAIWDQSRRRLLLARDRVGIKPLYFRHDPAKLLFCSELKGILAYGEVDRDIAPSSLVEYVSTGMVGGDSTIFRGIHKLLPGHTLAISPDEFTPRTQRYWQLDFNIDPARDEAQWIDDVRREVEECTAAHLIADVPVGSFLSGGLDSGIITALGAKHSPAALHTFSMGFADAAFNELPYARLVATRYGTRHVEEIVTPDAAALLDELCWYFDEPFADSSIVPTFLVSRMAARHVKVVLSGDGGDEAFGGYRRYVHDLGEDAVRSWLPQWMRRYLLSPLAAIWPQVDALPRPLRLKSALTNLALDPHAAYANTLTACRSPLLARLLRPDVLTSHPAAFSDRVREAFRSGHGDPLAGMIAADVATLLPDDYLVKVDRASMACGLEVRPPLLDHRLLELTARMPSRFKIRSGETKWVFKRACGELLPPELLSRPKQGFEIPVDSWLRGPLQDMFRDTVLAGDSRLNTWFQPAEIRSLWQQHTTGQRRAGQVLWSLLVLARWSEKFLSSSGPKSAAPRVAGQLAG